MNTDPRIQELEQLAAEEGLTLPMHPSFILWFEDSGYVVDLHTGIAWRRAQWAPESGMPTPRGKAVAHLLAHEVGVVAL